MRCLNRFAIRSLLALGVLGLAGCGASVEKGLVPVKGRVTRDGGSWPKPGKINFLPKTSTGEMRPASADFDTAGNFTVSSFEGSSGLYPGDYWASIECWEVEPGMMSAEEAKSAAKKPGATMMSSGKSAVPKKYQSPESSGLAVKVEAGHPVEVKFDVKSK